MNWPGELAGLAELDSWLARYRRYWTDHVDALERHLAERHGRPGTDQEGEQPSPTTASAP